MCDLGHATHRLAPQLHARDGFSLRLSVLDEETRHVGEELFECQHTTHATATACTKLLNYAATHPDAVIRFKASGMILHIHSDASYLSELMARSRVGGFFLAGPYADPPILNGPVHVVSKIMNNVMSSAAEAEVGGLFLNGQEACPIQTTLAEMGTRAERGRRSWRA